MLFFDRRTSPREPLHLRIKLTDGSTARTRNVCATGLYVVLPPGYQIDDWVSVELMLPERRLRVRAFGEVLRIERIARGIGVAMRLHETQLTRGDEHAT